MIPWMMVTMNSWYGWAGKLSFAFYVLGLALYTDGMVMMIPHGVPLVTLLGFVIDALGLAVAVGSSRGRWSTSRHGEEPASSGPPRLSLGQVLLFRAMGGLSLLLTVPIAFVLLTWIFHIGVVLAMVVSAALGLVVGIGLIFYGDHAIREAASPERP